jgi:hypothetical protein
MKEDRISQTVQVLSHLAFLIVAIVLLNNTVSAAQPTYRSVHRFARDFAGHPTMKNFQKFVRERERCDGALSELCEQFALELLRHSEKTRRILCDYIIRNPQSLLTYDLVNSLNCINVECVRGELGSINIERDDSIRVLDILERTFLILESK